MGRGPGDEVSAMVVEGGRIPALAAYAGRRRHLIPASLVLSALGAVLSVAPFYFIWLIVGDTVSAYPDAPSDDVVAYAWAALITAVASVALHILSLILSHLAAFRIARNLREVLTGHILSLPPGAMGTTDSGAVARTVRESVDSTHGFIAHGLPDLAGTYVMPVAVIGLLFAFDWRLGLAALVPAVAGLLVSLSMTGSDAMRESMADWQGALSDVEGRTVEYVRGMPVVKVFQQTVDSFRDLRESVRRYTGFCLDYTDASRRPITGFFALANGCTLSVIACAAVIAMASGGATAGLVADTVLYILIAPLVGGSLMRVMFSSNQVHRADDAVARIRSILSMRPLDEPAEPVVPDSYTVSLRDVVFSYSPDSPPAVDGINLDLEPGTVTALVGESGSGKSTVAGLVRRSWDPTSGSVSIGGVDLRDIGTEGVLSLQSHVFQDNHIVSGTLSDNVRLGRPDATEGEVDRAVDLARCRDIMDRLPDGMDTVVGPGGVHLSGGEVQRVAIARAVLRDTPIVVMDEATAFVDPENEHLIQGGFSELARGRTVLLIAHRLSTVRNADRICVMDRGRIVQSGTHDELVSVPGRYLDMWTEYNRSLGWRIGGCEHDRA